jgi:hypothetical protein
MVRLWLRNEVFDAVLPLRPSALGPKGQLPAVTVPPPQQLSQLMRALRLEDAKVVRYTSWVTEAWRVLQWNEPTAKLFWEMLCLSSRGSRRTQGRLRRSVDGQVSSAFFGGLNLSILPHLVHSYHNLGQNLPSELPATHVALFLFLHLHPDSTSQKLTISSHAAAHADSLWPPDEASSGPISPRRGGTRAFTFGSGGGGGYDGSSVSPTKVRAARLAARGHDDAHRLTFVKRRLWEVLRLASWDAAVCGGDGPPSEEESFTLSPAEIDDIGFLIGGGSVAQKESAVRTSSPLSELLGGRRLTAAQAHAALMSSLTINEIRYPVPPPPPPQSALAESQSAPSAMSWAAAESLAGASPVSVNCVIRTTVLRHHKLAENDDASSASPQQELRDLHVNHCHDSHIYILAPVARAVILGCTDCTIVVGAVAGLIRAVDCERIQVYIFVCVALG